MAIARDELLTREITREELKALVDTWVAEGGKIKQCKPADAYSFNLSASAGFQRTSSGSMQARKNFRGWLLKEKPAKKARKTRKK